MRNCNKVVNTCGGMSPLMCTEYESNVNVDSSLIDVDCKNGEEVIQDIYNQLSGLDLSALGELCLTYTKIGGKNVVKNILLKFEQEICTLKEEIQTLKDRQICDIPITECFPNGFDCLIGDCNNNIVTLKDWMLAMQTRICETP